jgi:pilus assembly protein CpaB
VLGVKLRGAGEDVLPSDNIPKGFRVVNVRVDSVSGTGLIVPGDRVDVLVFLQKNPSAGIAEASARTLLQDIKVYAVDAAFVGKHESDGQLVSGKTVSLMVTPQQAEKVTLASELGSIRLVVRSLNDDQESTSIGASVADIFGTEKNASAQEEKPVAGDGKGLAAMMPIPFPVPPPLPEAPPAAPPFKMVVIEGSAMREVAFPAEGLPVTDATEGSTSTPSELPSLPANGVTTPIAPPIGGQSPAGANSSDKGAS